MEQRPVLQPPVAPLHTRLPPPPPTYPARLLQRAVELTGLSYRFRALDLSLGSSAIASDLAPHAKSVTRAVVELPGKAAIGVADRRRHEQRVSRALAAVDGALGSFRLIAIDRSLSQIGGAALLAEVERLVDAHGALASFALHFPDVSENRWARELEFRFGYAPGELVSRPRWQPGGDERLLLQSSLDQLDCLTVMERRELEITQLEQRILRDAPSSHALAAHTDALRTMLLAHADAHGRVHEVVEGQVLIARHSRTLSTRWG